MPTPKLPMSPRMMAAAPTAYRYFPLAVLVLVAACGQVVMRGGLRGGSNSNNAQQVKSVDTSNAEPQRSLETTDAAAAAAVSTTLEAPRRKRLADGCFHVYLDVGSNIGIHARFVLEPERYPKSPSLQYFNDEFGAHRDNRDVCIFTFEPNPAHYDRHKALEAAYAKHGWRVIPMHAGVGDFEGNLTFQSRLDQNALDVGFSGVRHASKGMENETVTVPIVRLASFLQNEVHGRQLPAPHNGTLTEPKVVMKMDVEGMEIVLLPDLLASGALCQTVDLLFGEDHCRKSSLYPFDHPVTGDRILTHRSECHAFIDNMYKLMATNPHCPTRLITIDDESYIKDGKPLPE